MPTNHLIYLIAAFGGFALCLILEIIALRLSHRRIAALKIDATLAASLVTTEGRSS